MNKKILLSLFCLGTSSMMAQVVMIREIMASFYGNEFFIGWILFAWLAWSAAGSLAAAKASQPDDSFSGRLAGCHLALPLSLILEIVLIRLSRFFIGSAPGEIPDLIPSTLFVLLALAPFCFVTGYQFSITLRSCQRPDGASENVAAKAYGIETAGFLVAGVAFSYIFVRLSAFYVCALLEFLNFFAAGWFITGRSPAKKWGLVLPLIFLAIATFLGASRLEIATAAFRFPHERLIESQNTLYGNVTVTASGGQKHFFENGALAGAASEKMASEHFVHFPMLMHPAPRRILLIGTGFSGNLTEIFKYHPALVYYAELDPAMITAAGRHGSGDFREILRDPGLKVIRDDPKWFIDNARESFDVILLALGAPSSAQINRFYATDFFSELKKHLDPDGLLATSLPFSPNYVTPDLEKLAASVDKSLRSQFAHVLALPDENVLFIASSAPISTDPAILISRLDQQGIKNSFAVPAYLRYRLTNDRVASLEKLLKANRSALRNRSLRPSAYYYNLIYWVDHFHSFLAQGLKIALRMPSWALLAAFLLPFWMLLVSGSGGDRQHGAYLWAMSIAGFSIMAAEMVVIYLFQIIFGNLYYKISWIITAFMTGLGAGAWCHLKIKILQTVKVSTVHLFAAFYFAAVVILMRTWLLSPEIGSLLKEILFVLISLAIGVLVGFEFSLINEKLAQGGSFAHAGWVYGADLLGASVGALLTGVFLIPIYGITHTLILLVIMNLLPAVMLWKPPKS